MRMLIFTVSVLAPMLIFCQHSLKAEPALEILSKFSKVRDLALSKDADEAYFTVQSLLEEVSVIATSVKTHGKWSFPKIASFSGKHKDLEPFLSLNGLRLFFVSDRALTDTINAPKDYDIWYVERKEKTSAWSRPINMGSPINSEYNEFYPSIAANGNFYFTSDAPTSKGKDDIFFSAWENNTYSQPVSLSTAINTAGFEYNAFIAPNESYIIFGGYDRKDGMGSGDLYISFKTDDGHWQTAQPLAAPINSKYMDYCPFVDSTAHTLYFTSRRSGIHRKPFLPLRHWKGK